MARSRHCPICIFHQPLRDALAQYGNKLEIVEVPDITAIGACLDDAVKGKHSRLRREGRVPRSLVLSFLGARQLTCRLILGVDAVAHLAAPVSFFFTDPEPVMKGLSTASPVFSSPPRRSPR